MYLYLVSVTFQAAAPSDSDGIPAGLLFFFCLCLFTQKRRFPFICNQGQVAVVYYHHVGGMEEGDKGTQSIEFVYFCIPVFRIQFQFTDQLKFFEFRQKCPGFLRTGSQTLRYGT